MEFLAVCVVGIPLAFRYGPLWLLRAGVMFVAGVALVRDLDLLAAWGWTPSHWPDAFITACYVIAYLLWKVKGGGAAHQMQTRGWSRAREVLE